MQIPVSPGAETYIEMVISGRFLNSSVVLSRTLHLLTVSLVSGWIQKLGVSISLQY